MIRNTNFQQRKETVMDNIDVNHILEKVDIVDIISRYIPLTSKGKSLVGVCPFHDDHDPSMYVSREKQIFKCFTCGTGGNAIKFVQTYENITYRQAIEKVADIAGIAIKKTTVPEIDVDPMMQRMYMLNQHIADYANYMLQNTTSTDVSAYLQERQITLPSQDKFQLGYIQDSSKLVNFLLKKGFTSEELENSKVFNEKGRCLFEKRLLMPIGDLKSNIIGFTSRKIINDASAKYINSADSSIYDKSHSIYNIHNAVMQNSTHEVLLVEGTMDVIGLDQAGFKNAIATLGTALTLDQAKQIKELKLKPKICYDGDNPGRNATLKAVDTLQKVGIQPSIVILPNGVDPDELYKSDLDLLKKLIHEDNNVFDFKLRTMPSFQNFQEKQLYINEFLTSLSQEHDVLYHEEYLTLLSQKTDISYETLKRKFQESYKATPKTAHQVAKKVVHQQAKTSKKALINVKIKDSMEYKKEVHSNYDVPHAQESVMAFDQKNILDRTDVLKKYIYLKGPVFETTITCLQKDVDQSLAKSMCAEAVDAICMNNCISHANSEYLAYLHTNTNFPHIHLQVWQKEPFLANYKVSEDFVKTLQNKIDKVLSTPLDYMKNPLIAQTEHDMDLDIEEIQTASISI